MGTQPSKTGNPGQGGQLGALQRPSTAGDGAGFVQYNPADKLAAQPSRERLSAHGSDHSISTSVSTSASSTSPSRTAISPSQLQQKTLRSLQGTPVNKPGGQLRRSATAAGGGRDSPMMPLVNQRSEATRSPPPSRPGTGASLASVATGLAPGARMSAAEAYRREQQKRFGNVDLPGQLPEIDSESPPPPASQPTALSSFKLRPGTTGQAQFAHLRPSSTGPGAKTVQGHRPSSSPDYAQGPLHQPFSLPQANGASNRRPMNPSHAGGGGRIRIEDPAQAGAVTPSRPSNPSGRKGIRLVDDVSLYYKLGGNVMPSCHSGMEVRNGMRANAAEDGNNETFVVKVRYKNKSFQGRNDEQKWRTNTELILNIPHCRGIARVHEVIEDPKAYYVIMERAGGCDLYECLTGAPEKRLPPHEAKDILRELLSAVVELHQHGFIHKDLKLENVMLNKAGPKCPAHIRRSLATSPGAGVKLIDFDTVEEWTAETPKAKHVLGTDQYIAPEAYEGLYSPLSDVFAVGVIAYRLLTGTFPFNGRLFDDKPGENWVGSPKMKEIKEKLYDARVSFRHPVFESEPGAQNLISRMLSAREMERPDSKECLSDPWLASAGDIKASTVAAGRPVHFQDPAVARPVSVQYTRGRPVAIAHPQVGQQRVSTASAAVSSQPSLQYWAADQNKAENRPRKRAPTDSLGGTSAASTQESWHVMDTLH